MRNYQNKCQNMTVSHYNTVVYITASYKNSRLWLNYTSGYSIRNFHIDRKGQLRKYSQFLLLYLNIHTSCLKKRFNISSKNHPLRLTVLGTFKLYLSSSTLCKLGQIISNSWITALKVRVTIYCKMVGKGWNAPSEVRSFLSHVNKMC